jgi:fermentation-respiration switch protein FrsA (DUF1100 family)
MSDADQKKLPVENKVGSVSEDTIANTAMYTRRPPKTTAEFWSEFAKTGNPLAWCLMKLWEPHFEFAPQRVYTDGEQGQTLQPPIRYGLKHYRVNDLHLDSGETVTAWYKPAEKGYPTIVYCHGNAGSLDGRAAILKEMTDRGFGAIIAGYPGFKRRRMPPLVQPSENACYATGHAMVRYLQNRRGVPMENIVLFGESLGGAVALRTALNLEKGVPEMGYEPCKVPAVICYNTFTSLVKRAKEQFPMLPADALMGNRFESDKIIANVKAPVLLMHGKADEYTSCRHSIDLEKASEGKATLELLDGVTHSATYPGTDKQDPEQLRRLIDCAHQYLHERGLCPSPPVRKKAADDVGANWKTAVTKPDTLKNDELGR